MDGLKHRSLLDRRSQIDALKRMARPSQFLDALAKECRQHEERRMQLEQETLVSGAMPGEFSAKTVWDKEWKTVQELR